MLLQKSSNWWLGKPEGDKMRRLQNGWYTVGDGQKADGTMYHFEEGGPSTRCSSSACLQEQGFITATNPCCSHGPMHAHVSRNPNQGIPHCAAVSSIWTNESATAMSVLIFWLPVSQLRGCVRSSAWKWQTMPCLHNSCSSLEPVPGIAWAWDCSRFPCNCVGREGGRSQTKLCRMMLQYTPRFGRGGVPEPLPAANSVMAGHTNAPTGKAQQ